MTHQSSNTEYQIRINGKAVYYDAMLSSHTFDKYAKICADNPNDYVDITMVRTEILLNQGTYHQLKRHLLGLQTES